MKHACRVVMILAGIGAAGLGLDAAGAEAFEGTYTFDVLRNGEPVGLHTFTFRHEAGRIEIQEDSEFEVKLAFIPIYSFAHHHREVWEHGDLVRVESFTDKNGEMIDLTLEAEDGGLVRTVNGRTDHLGPEVTPLAVWNQDVLDGSRFVSVAEDKLIEASFVYLGTETREVAGAPMELEHYKLGGEAPREVWYDPAGHVARVKLERGDSVMEYVRNEPTIELPKQLACLTAPGETC
jgi:hypothetical protein